VPRQDALELTGVEDEGAGDGGDAETGSGVAVGAAARHRATFLSQTRTASVSTR